MSSESLPTSIGPVRRSVSQSSARESPGLIKRGELTQLRLLGEVRHADAGTAVAAAGSVVTHVQVVADGELELLARLPSGRRAVAVVRTGGVIQDVPLLLDKPMPFDAVATRDTEMIALSRQRWAELLQSSPTLAVRWMASIARRLDDDRRRLVVMTSRPLVAQVAYLLLELAETQASGERVVALSHTRLAHLLGAQRQSVTRVITGLRRDGLVSTRYGATVLEDIERLREVVGPEP